MVKIAFIPSTLDGWHKLYHAKLAGLFRISQIEDADIVFNWNSESVYTQPLVIAGKRVVNGMCTNVSKANVDAVFTKVYGYSSLTNARFVVEKRSDFQGKKDARLIDSEQTPRREGYVYQIPFIEISGCKQRIIERRHVIMNYRPVMTIVKIKDVSIDDLIGETIDLKVGGTTTDERIGRFCDEIGLEFGEVDVMNFYDKDYIIDANNIAGDAAFFKSEHIKRVWLDKFKENYL